MSGFIQNSVISKVFDATTYYLIPVSITDTIKMQIDAGDALFGKFDSEWGTALLDVDFKEEIAKLLMACFPEVIGATSDILTYLNRPNYVSYLLFSDTQLNNSFEYYLLNDGELDLEIVAPLSICSMELFQNDTVQIKRAQTTAWERVDYYILYNVCRRNEMESVGICSKMLNMIVNDAKYTEFPIFLFVNPSNLPAMKCYTKNHFQTVVDVFTGEKLPHDAETIYMCYNKYTLKLNDGTREYQVSPANKTRFVLVAHGALGITSDAAFSDKPFNHLEYEIPYYYPFHNMQFYTQLGRGLFSGKDDESNAVFDVCYENIIAKQILQPTDKKELKLIPMVFSGFNEKTDPPGRAAFIGLYNCNLKTRIKENAELFGPNNDEILQLATVLKYLYKHCIDNDIDVRNVEVKIFACRGFCPVGDFATVVGGNVSVDAEQFISNEKDDFYEFLRKQPQECDLPQEPNVATGGKKRMSDRRLSRDHKKTRRSLVKSARRTVRKSRGGRERGRRVIV